jgi:O-antigen/teichoic acid export membrane protein
MSDKKTPPGDVENPAGQAPQSASAETEGSEVAVPRGKASSFSLGIIWNMGSLIFLALAGFILNIVIGRVYGPEALGVFNIAFALYIFLSQFGSFGLHFSILQAISEHAQRDQAKVDDAAAQGFVAVLIASASATAFGLLLTPVFGWIFDIDGLTSAWLLILPGLFAFSLNKFLYGVINGARHMRTFAVLQALRYILILLSLVGLYVARAPAHWLTLVFTIAELVLLPILFFYASHVVTRWPWQGERSWLKQHFFFGARAFLSGAILELNTRVDVLLIGFYLNEERVGVFSIALLIAEGASQAIFAIRNNVNPHLARFVADKDVDGLLKFSRKIASAFTAFMIVVSSVTVFAFPIFDALVFEEGVYADAQMPLAFLMGGLALSSGLFCFNMILSQAKKPGAHSLYVMSVLLVNVVLNALLIPVFGITGSGIATGLSYIYAVIAIVIIARKVLGVRILV